MEARKARSGAPRLYSVTFGPPGCQCKQCANGGVVPIDLDFERIQEEVANTWISVELRSDATTASVLPRTPRTDRIPPDITASQYIDLIAHMTPALFDRGPCGLLINGKRSSPNTLIRSGDQVTVSRFGSH